MIVTGRPHTAVADPYKLRFLGSAHQVTVDHEAPADKRNRAM